MNQNRTTTRAVAVAALAQAQSLRVALMGAICGLLIGQVVAVGGGAQAPAGVVVFQGGVAALGAFAGAVLTRLATRHR